VDCYFNLIDEMMGSCASCAFFSL